MGNVGCSPQYRWFQVLLSLWEYLVPRNGRNEHLKPILKWRGARRQKDREREKEREVNRLYWSLHLGDRLALVCITDGNSIGKEYLLSYSFTFLIHMVVLSTIWMCNLTLSSCMSVLMKCVGETGASCHNFYFSQWVWFWKSVSV